MAFGTGHHATTMGCLLALDRLDREGFRARNVADIGCGTAVLAMGAAAIWPDPVIASDIDPVAVEVARANVVANRLDDRVACVEAAGFGHPALAERAPYDLVFANILKGPLMSLAPEMARSVAPGGVTILPVSSTRRRTRFWRPIGRRGFLCGRATKSAIGRHWC